MSHVGRLDPAEQLQAANISKERLASFDRSIKSEPKFSKEQCPGLKRDLIAYLHTLKACC